MAETIDGVDVALCFGISSVTSALTREACMVLLGSCPIYVQSARYRSCALVNGLDIRETSLTF